MIRVLLAGTVVFAFLSGCAHSPPAEPVAAPPSAQAPGRSGEMMAMCPMDVSGTRVSAADTADGATLTFTGAEQPAELRSRVHAMAEMHNRHHADGVREGMMGGGEGMMGGAEGMMGGGEGMMGGSMMPPSHATAADLDSGASITVTPDAPADLQKVQSAVRMHAERMQQSGCAMMGK